MWAFCPVSKYLVMAATFLCLWGVFLMHLGTAGSSWVLLVCLGVLVVSEEGYISFAIFANSLCFNAWAAWESITDLCSSKLCLKVKDVIGVCLDLCLAPVMVSSLGGALSSCWYFFISIGLASALDIILDKQSYSSLVAGGAW